MDSGEVWEDRQRRGEAGEEESIPEWEDGLGREENNGDESIREKGFAEESEAGEKINSEEGFKAGEEKVMCKKMSRVGPYSGQNTGLFYICPTSPPAPSRSTPGAPERRGE